MSNGTEDYTRAEIKVPLISYASWGIKDDDYDDNDGGDEVSDDCDIGDFGDVVYDGDGGEAAGRRN